MADLPWGRLPTVAALRANPVIRAFYDRLVAQGKPRLLTILNAIVRHQTPNTAPPTPRTRDIANLA